MQTVSALTAKRGRGIPLIGLVWRSYDAAVAKIAVLAYRNSNGMTGSRTPEISANNS